MTDPSKETTGKHYKQLIFDLDTVLLKELYGDDYTEVYYWIRTFLDKKGFDHLEGSGYLSRKMMSDVQLARVIRSLIRKYPFLDKCVKKIHSANVTSKHSWSDYFHYDGTLGDLKSDDQE